MTTNKIWAWAWGASLALMFAMSEATYSQGIVYGTPQPPAYYAAPFIYSYSLDVNGDGVTDFLLNSQGDSAVIAPMGNNSIIAIPEPPPDLGSLIPALPSGFTIGSSLDPIFQWYHSNTDQFGAAAIGSQQDIGSISYFLGLTAYAGFDLYYAGADHYGWMRIANLDGVVSGQILDWAYETDPNTPILAGQVPEPSTWVLLTTGAGLMLYRRKIFL